MNNDKRILCTILALCWLLCSCVTSLMEVPPGPLAYMEGFKDGCNSGYVAAGHPYYTWTKDHDWYNDVDDILYKQGWDDGFIKCKGKYESIQM